MVNAARTQRIYDHRLRNLVFSTGRIEIALDRGVPRPTARGWLRISLREVVSIDELEHSVEELRKQVFALRERNSAVSHSLPYEFRRLLAKNMTQGCEKQHCYPTDCIFKNSPLFLPPSFRQRNHT